MSDDANKQLGLTPPITTRGLQVAGVHNVGQFKEGHAPHPGPGRPKGSRNRIKADLSQMIMNGAAAVGFLQLDEKGKRLPLAWMVLTAICCGVL
jgi:hypothetical protein